MGTTAFLAACLVPCSYSALLPPFYVECVVALGRVQSGGPGQPTQWITEASGFLYGVAADAETDMAKHQYRVYLVTNRHVLAGHTQITMRLNPETANDRVRELPINLKDERGMDQWFSHPDPNIDVSVIHLNGPYLREQHLQSTFFANDRNAADKAKLKDIGFSIGDEVFVLGFPMGIYGTAQRNYVIARRGGIARINDMLESTSPVFLIDAFVFPGNSGGPVVSVPSINFIQGTKAQERSYIIGMVRSYIPYNETLVSQQTGQLRMVTQENSGLAEVIPMDYIDETIRLREAAERKAHP
jgi:S1-C subfamily serine protease